MAAKRVGIIGYPIRHSASPAFQNAALRHCGVDAVFTAWEVAPEALTRWVWDQDRTDLLGFGVTVPHKTEIIKQLDHVDDDAASIGAVNTVVVTERRELVGYNTDTYGFLHALQTEGGFDVRGQDVLVLGAGGVSRAVCGVLLREGVASLTLANRTVSRAESLLADLDHHGVPVQSVALDEGSIAEALRGRERVSLIVNCTSMGMLHGPAEGASPISAGLIPPSAFVYDLVYNPPVTPLMALAQGVGARTLNGLPMLVYQGARGFTLWTGIDAPVDVMMAAAREAVEG
ncbi:MAG: shikimate dehydrogenase [Chloroflexota bacterium]|nr:shikimate dehydrogenase [Chloroflexota bacterium]MDE2969147.1 shikimate dehydrogenase [Chloroflexota bacterium]